MPATEDHLPDAPLFVLKNGIRASMPLITALKLPLKYNASSYFYIHAYELKGTHFNNVSLFLHVLLSLVELLPVFTKLNINMN